ncbi:MAG: hypothetical protein HY825_17395 [Acidobacteria bacterium]|nr:hypothetical protein [Acidobacteriota bacterium]
MSEQAITSVGELLSRMRQGMVPRSVRLFAAQGLLPVSREDLIRVLAFLAAEGDEEIASTTRETLATFTTENFRAVLQLDDITALDIDLLGRAVHDDSIWQAIVRHPRTANETLRWMARLASPPTQDAIVTNQVRILSCLEILADLRANPQVSQDILRRVREFEEEFLEKAVQWATAVEAEPKLAEGPSIEDALAALKEIGMKFVPELLREATIEGEEEEAGAPREIRDAYVRIALMNTFQRVMTALKGTKEERLILARDRNTLVVRAVMMSPRLNELEVEQIAGMRSVTDEALRLIAVKGRWIRRYGIVHNLAFNPKTPAGLAIQLLGRLSQRDLAALSRDRNVSGTVRRVAVERYAARK